MEVGINKGRPMFTVMQGIYLYIMVKQGGTFQGGTLYKLAGGGGGVCHPLLRINPNLIG